MRMIIVMLAFFVIGGTLGSLGCSMTSPQLWIILFAALAIELSGGGLWR